VAQVRRNAHDDDLFGFLIHRGWLFLRLYLFMFVFSEPGSWKRWVMIAVAAIVCLQPRDSPLTRAVAAARRHLDNLIGPPARPQPAPAGAGAGQTPPETGAAGANAPRPANVRGAVQMTPEEAAARLLREQNARQQPPRFWRDTFYRVEQSTALFLASLVPGVGERHVRAREEARREAQRLEEERQRREREAAEEAQAAATTNGDGGDQLAEAAKESAAGLETGPDRPDAPGTSSSVQVQGTGEEAGELRNRAN
jgi:hypothetical protein